MNLHQAWSLYSTILSNHCVKISLIRIFLDKLISYFLLIKNLPKHVFAWNKKYFPWNNYSKNFVMLSKNLLDSSKFFLTVRQAIFFWPKIDWLKTRRTFTEISNIKVLRVSTNNLTVFLSYKESLQLLYYEIITETCT